MPFFLGYAPCKNGPTRHSPGSWSTLHRRSPMSIGFDGEGECSSTSNAGRRGWGRLLKCPTRPRPASLRALLGLTSLQAAAGCKVGLGAYASSIPHSVGTEVRASSPNTNKQNVTTTRENPSSNPPAGHAPRKCSRETVVPLTGTLLHTTGWIRRPLAPCFSPPVWMRPSPRLEAGAGDDRSHVSRAHSPPFPPVQRRQGTPPLDPA